MGTRERRLARAERLRGWAEKRETKADAGFERAGELASVIPFGQPILAGHYSQGRDTRYRARIGSTMDRAVVDARKGAEMRSKAENIEAAAGRAIYSDDSDAIEALEARIAGLEGERDRWKAYNAACRKAKIPTAAALELLDDAQRRTVISMANARQLKPNGAAPSYATSNLSANIKRNRDRLAELQGLVKCAEPGCGATFFPVPGRGWFCIDHACDFDRIMNGWSPTNSVD